MACRVYHLIAMSFSSSQANIFSNLFNMPSLHFSLDTPDLVCATERARPRSPVGQEGCPVSENGILDSRC